MHSATQRKDAIRRPPSERRAVHDRGGTADSLRLVVRTTNGVVLLAVHEIEYLEAAGNLVVVHTAAEKYRIRVTLSALLDRLGGRGFLRIHRCVVVRAAAITAIEKGAYRKALAVLRSGARLEIGRAEFNRLRALWQPGVLDLGELSSTRHMVDKVLAGV